MYSVSPVISWAPGMPRKATAMPTSSIETRLRLGALDCGLCRSSAKAGSAGSARGFTRAWRDGMHPDALGAELGRQVACGRFQGRLHGPHDVVVLHHHLGAVVGHR